MSSSAIEQNASFSSTILMLLVVVWFDKNWPRHSKYRDCLLIDWIRQSEERKKKNTEIFSKIHLIDLYKVHGQVHRISEYTWSSSPSSSRIASHHDNEIIGSYLMMMMVVVVVDDDDDDDGKVMNLCPCIVRCVWEQKFRCTKTKRKRNWNILSNYVIMNEEKVKR